MTFLSKGNWWLKLLALVLAIVIYHTLKNKTVRTDPANDRQHLFK